jgi:hypothetical protein
MADFLEDVLDDADGSDPVSESLLRARLRQRFSATFADAADLAAFQTIDSDTILVGGRLYRYVTTGAVDGARILEDADHRLFASTGLRLIEQQVVSSAVAAVNFTTGLADEFDLELWIDDVSSDNTSSTKLVLQTSADAGGSYAATGYHSNGATYAASTFTLAGSNTGIVIAGGSTTTGITTNAWCGEFYIRGLGLVSHFTRARGSVVDAAATGKGYQGGGRYATKRAENAFRLLFDVGNIDAGTFTLWGRD